MLLLLVALLMMPLSWLRLTTFSHNLYFGMTRFDCSKILKKKSPSIDRTFYNRGAELIKVQRYAKETSDLSKAKLYLGKARALEGLNDSTAAMQAYKQACLLGLPTACQKTGQSGVPVKSVSEYLLHP